MGIEDRLTTSEKILCLLLEVSISAVNSSIQEQKDEDNPIKDFLAWRLLRVFFTQRELAEGRIGKRVTSKYAHLNLLDQIIVTAIMETSKALQSIDPIHHNHRGGQEEVHAMSDSGLHVIRGVHV
ncbi:hypothetical protein ACROYT_G015222 [Oculina patagonica]